MSDLVPPNSGSLLSKHRIEALSDGVFAVVMTLLVLEIKPDLEPHSGDEAVRHVLANLARPFLAFAFAFLLSCVFWNLHRRKFSMLRHTNPVHTGLTLAFLFAVTLLPVSVSIFLRAMSSYLAQTVYYGNFTLIALPLLLSWLYAQRAGLVDPDHSAAVKNQLTRRMVAITTLGLIATTSYFFGIPSLLLLALPVILYFRLKKTTPATP